MEGAARRFMLMALAGWWSDQRQAAVWYLIEENRILRAQLHGRRVRLTDEDRRRLARAGHRLGRRLLRQVATIVTPDTILRWHRLLIARKWTYAKGQRRRSGVLAEIRQLVIRMAEENPTWGYTRIRGALKNLRHRVGRSTIARILKAQGIPPVPERPTSWQTFLRAHWGAIAGADFFTTEVWTWRGLVTYYTIFVIDLASRRVHVVGSTPHPDEGFMRQVGRTLTATDDGVLIGHRVLICDRDAKWSAPVRERLSEAGIRVVQTPYQAPNANAYAERFVRSIKHECLNRVIPFGEQHFRRTIGEFVAHYHGERNHQETMRAGRRSKLLAEFKLKEAVMTATTTRPAIGSVSEPTLYVAFELGQKEWTLALTSGFSVTPWVRTVPSGDWAAVERVVQAARSRCRVAGQSRVVSCYEAGRDGFWIHRALTHRGVENRVVDSASIEVNRRARRTKTDRIDALKLVMMLVRVCGGEQRVWREVRVPSVAAEAARHVSRERTALTQERTRLRNQIGSWLATWGCAVAARRRRTAQWWATVRDWAQQPLPAAVQARIARAEARLALIAEHLATLTVQQAAATRRADPDSALGRLVQLKGVATTSASVLLDEGLVWRDFHNRRELGGLLGFAPAKYDSGESTRDQGISRAGNVRLQAVSIQLAWSWVRWQPLSALTQWYHAHFGTRKRARRVGIVAVARKLIIALWRYATRGIVPPGAIVKPTRLA